MSPALVLSETLRNGGKIKLHNRVTQIMLLQTEQKVEQSKPQFVYLHHYLSALLLSYCF